MSILTEMGLAICVELIIANLALYISCSLIEKDEFLISR